MPHDPGMTALILGAGSALLALLAMGRIACSDIGCMSVRYAEIDPDWVTFAGWSALAAIVAVEGGEAYLDGVMMATVTGGTAWLMRRTVPRGQGAGDIGLFAVIGVCAGSEHLPLVAAVGSVFATATGMAYGLARGKRFRHFFLRHLVPWALPFMAVVAPMFALRVAGGIWPETIPQVADGVVVIALAGTALLSAGLVAGPLPMAVRRRAAVKAAAPRGHDGRIQQSKRGKET